MDNLYSLEPEMIKHIRQQVPDLKTVASFSVLAGASDPLEQFPACYVLPLTTEDFNEGRRDDQTLARLESYQHWQVLICVGNVIDPDDFDTTAKTAGARMAEVRAALLGWVVPTELGGMLHPQGISEPLHLRDFTQFPMFFRQHTNTTLEAAS